MRELTLGIFLCIIATLLSCNQNSLQEKKIITIKDTVSTTIEKKSPREFFTLSVDNLPNELLEFIPTNYSVLDTASGDLNFDKIEDYILILKKNGEDTLSSVVDHPESRPLLILLREQNGKLQLARRNDNTVYCIDCGGMMSDPFMGITIKNGYFSIEHYGGSALRWTRIITYKYFKQDKEWFLYKIGSESFHALEIEKVESRIETAKDFGRIKFEDFNIYKIE